MQKIFFKNHTVSAVIAIVFLFAINGRMLLTIVNTDFLGILAGISLFVIGGRKTNFKLNYFLFAFIVLLELISFRLHTKSVHFLSLILFCCLVFHYFTGRFSFIAFICIILFSTFFSALSNHLTSEIKQGLCYGVYLTLKNFIAIDKIEGVNFYINNAKITIDTACMGLSMFKTGLLSGAVLMTLEEKKQKQFYGTLQILFFCFLVILLNIVSNYFRIITLVIFNCTEENTLHHTIGLLCFILYQIVPMLILIKFIKPKFTQHEAPQIKSGIRLVIVSFVILLTTSFQFINQTDENFIRDLNSTYDTTKGTWINNEVFKIDTRTKLTYIKTVSHNPLICWTGDGYKIIKSKKIVIANHDEIWFNKMEKANYKYSSYWWYECDGKKYTSLIGVLLQKLIYNKPIFLINETIKSI
ncbi:exosortase N [Flavobacterium gelatinilyticum]|uniref:exosortase N n=1 Tax=Flavobacterium gelatinilyticum TaxID=3003260 RepID=UPI002480F4D1|nr:exosortase N [Flavobacterium gelatinilyticum]